MFVEILEKNNVHLESSIRKKQDNVSKRNQRWQKDKQTCEISHRSYDQNFRSCQSSQRIRHTPKDDIIKQICRFRRYPLSKLSLNLSNICPLPTPTNLTSSIPSPPQVNGTERSFMIPSGKPVIKKRRSRFLIEI